MYSDMSSVINALSSPNRNSVSVLASSVLPTPVGPRKMNDPHGRFGSFRPARVRRIDCDTAATALSWPMIRLWRFSSIFSRRLAVSSSVSLYTGMPGPDRQHLGDRFLVDLVEQVDAVGLDLELLGGLLLEQRLLLVAEAAGLLELLLLDGALLRFLHLVEACVSRSRRSGGAWPCA